MVTIVSSDYKVGPTQCSLGGRCGDCDPSNPTHCGAVIPSVFLDLLWKVDVAPHKNSSYRLRDVFCHVYIYIIRMSKYN